MIDKKAEIYKCGKELFKAKGFKDTNISEITKMAGMATGTFYIYYDSKDALFMEIFNDENAKLKKKMLSNVDLDDEPLTIMRKMMAENYKGILGNPILKEWLNREVFQKIEKNFREKNGFSNVDFFNNGMLEIIIKLQSDGKLRSDIDAKLIMAMFTSLIHIETHKYEIGFEYFPKVIEYLSEFTLKGLLIDKK